LWGSVCHHVEREASRLHDIYPRGDVETKETLRFDVAKKTVEIANRAKEQH